MKLVQDVRAALAPCSAGPGSGLSRGRPTAGRQQPAASPSFTELVAAGDSQTRCEVLWEIFQVLRMCPHRPSGSGINHRKGSPVAKKKKKKKHIVQGEGKEREGDRGTDISILFIKAVRRYKADLQLCSHPGTPAASQRCTGRCSPAGRQRTPSVAQ